jgi:two-component system, LytTR family, response regulator
MEHKLTALIVDDENGARRLLKKLLEETSFFFDIRLAQSVASAREVLIGFEPDMIFLDIRMPGKDGFEIVRELPFKREMPGIVFVTAHEEYAIEAIKNHAFDYLLKPVSRDELKLCIIRFIEARKTNISTEGNNNNDAGLKKIDRIRINTRTGTLFVNPETILYCKAEGNYTEICTGEKQHLCTMNIGKLMDQLPRNGFIRIGRSYIINFEYISFLDRKESSVTLVRDGQSAKVKISRRHLKDLDLV